MRDFETSVTFSYFAPECSESNRNYFESNYIIGN